MYGGSMVLTWSVIKLFLVWQLKPYSQEQTTPSNWFHFTCSKQGAITSYYYPDSKRGHS